MNKQRESYERAEEDVKVEFKEGTTIRGFELIEFIDHNGKPSSIQASSLALYEPPGTSALLIGAGKNRMHLTIENVQAVRDYLTRWLDTQKLCEMGYYIEVPKNLDKAEQLMDLHGATWTLRPKSWEDIPKGKALIIIVCNGLFDAALFVADKMEFDRCVPERPDDPRPRTFMLMDRKKAEELTGWKPKKEDP